MYVETFEKDARRSHCCLFPLMLIDYPNMPLVRYHRAAVIARDILTVRMLFADASSNVRIHQAQPNISEIKIRGKGVTRSCAPVCRVHFLDFITNRRILFRPPDDPVKAEARATNNRYEMSAFYTSTPLADAIAASNSRPAEMPTICVCTRVGVNSKRQTEYLIYVYVYFLPRFTLNQFHDAMQTILLGAA